MQEDSFFPSVKRRMIAMAENPPYRFRDTWRDVAAQYQKRRSTFAGTSPKGIEAAEAELGLCLSRRLFTYFEEMGEVAGDLFIGSDLAHVSALGEYHLEAEEIVANLDAAPLPAEALVFLIHQGYQVAYQLGTPIDAGRVRTEDCPVYTFNEGDSAPRLAAPSFKAFVEAEVAMHEEVYRNYFKLGGYYLKVHAGQFQENHPTLNERPRPLDTGDQFLD